MRKCECEALRGRGLDANEGWMQVPPYALVLMTFSKRLHSIYVLRMFNDGVAMLFLYAAVLAWTSKRPRWTTGCIIFR